VVLPGALDRPGEHAAAQPAPAQRRFAQQVVQAVRVLRHVDQAAQFGQILRVVTDSGPLEQSDGPAGQQQDEVLAQLLATHARTEVALDRLRGRLVVPPAGNARLG